MVPETGRGGEGRGQVEEREGGEGRGGDRWRGREGRGGEGGEGRGGEGGRRGEEREEGEEGEGGEGKNPGKNGQLVNKERGSAKDWHKRRVTRASEAT